MAEDVRQWLKDLGCEHYHPIFIQNGFTSVAALGNLSESALNRMAVINPSHRQAILSKSKGLSGGTSKVGGGVDFGDDFDALLGDLTSAIADLESLAVPTGRSASIPNTNPALLDSGSLSRRSTVPAVPTTVGTASGSSSGSSTPLGGGTPYNSLQREEKKPIQGFNPEASLKDTDLDALLTDLCEFDPMQEVTATQMPTNPIQLMSPSRHVYQSAAVEPQTPPLPYHQHQNPPPTLPKSNGIVPPPKKSTPPPLNPTPESSPAIHREQTNVTDGKGDFEMPPPPGEGGPQSPHITPVHEPKLTGASEEITKVEVDRRLEAKEEELRSNSQLSEEEVATKMKEEKMKIALEKMKLASKRKVAIKVFNNDGSNKTVVVEEGMTSAVVCYLLVTKNHFEESPNWTIIERLGDVGLERELEDHEFVEEIYTHWARDSNNQFLFRRNDLKYEIFTDPIKYFPALLTSTMIGKDSKDRTDKARKILVQEYFTSALRVPEIEGFLHLKDGYKNKWKKIYVILRASGLYQTLKGKAKTARNLQMLVQFEDFDLYRGMNFKKMLKAPTDFCFALRPKPEQMVPGAKDIKVLCADSEDEFISWFAGCRLAKYGHTLYDNYYKAHIKQFKLEDAETQAPGSSAEQRAYSLSGMRLEKHLDKKREEYQREKEAKEAQGMMFKQVVQEQENDHDDEETPSPHVPPKPAPKPAQKPGPKPAPKPTPKPLPQQQSPFEQPTPPVVPPVDENDTPPLDPLSQYPWYHGSIPREEAIRRLEQSGARDGVFLVRDSSSVPNSFVLTMFAKSVPKNFQIMPYEGPDNQIIYRIDDGPAFKSVPEVLQHYHETADRLPCKLTDFCPRPPTRMTEC